MITRTTIGANFEGALSYGAGLSQRGAGKKAELIGSANLGDVSNPRGLAAEMQSVADANTKCKNPVWHTSLSWAEGEQVSTAQKLLAAERYCEIIGARWDAHQVAVFEHHDTKHAHIHIYFNRVPVAGGPAIDTGHNYARNLKAIKLISQELGLAPLPAQRQSIQDSRPVVQDTRQAVRAALVEALADVQVQSLAQLQERLAAQGIEARLKRSQAGELVGVSFRQGEAAVTGQEVGMKAAQLRDHYEPRQVQAQTQVQQPVVAQFVAEVAQPSTQAPQVAPAEVAAQLVGQVQQPVAADVARERAREQLCQALAAVLAAATNGPTLAAGLHLQQVAYQVQPAAAGPRSMSFTQNGHTFQGSELGPAYTVEGMAAQMKANREREAQQAQPAAQLVPDAAKPSTQAPQPFAPEQRPVAAQPLAAEQQPKPPAPAVKPEPPKQATPKKKGPRLS